MTEFEDIARLKLVVDNPVPRMPERRRMLDGIIFFLALITSVSLVLAGAWFVACLLLSLE